MLQRRSICKKYGKALYRQVCGKKRHKNKPDLKVQLTVKNPVSVQPGSIYGILKKPTVSSGRVSGICIRKADPYNIGELVQKLREHYQYSNNSPCTHSEKNYMQTYSCCSHCHNTTPFHICCFQSLLYL